MTSKSGHKNVPIFDSTISCGKLFHATIMHIKKEYFTLLLKVVEAQKKFFLNLIFQTDKPHNISDFCQKSMTSIAKKSPHFLWGYFVKREPEQGST